MIKEKAEVTNSEVRRELLALRRKYDADTPIGRGCSNIDEQIQNNAPPALIEWQMARLRRLLTAAQGGRRM